MIEDEWIHADGGWGARATGVTNATRREAIRSIVFESHGVPFNITVRVKGSDLSVAIVDLADARGVVRKKFDGADDRAVREGIVTHKRIHFSAGAAVHSADVIIQGCDLVVKVWDVANREIVLDRAFRGALPWMEPETEPELSETDFAESRPSRVNFVIETFKMDMFVGLLGKMEAHPGEVTMDEWNFVEGVWNRADPEFIDRAERRFGMTYRMHGRAEAAE